MKFDCMLSVTKIAAFCYNMIVNNRQQTTNRKTSPMTEYKKRKIEAQRHVISTFAEMLAEAEEASRKSKELMRWRNKHACSNPAPELKAEALAKKAEFDKNQAIVSKWKTFFKNETCKRMSLAR